MLVLSSVLELTPISQKKNVDALTTEVMYYYYLLIKKMLKQNSQNICTRWELSALIRFVCLGGTRQPSCVLESSISLFLLEEIEKPIYCNAKF